MLGILGPDTDHAMPLFDQAQEIEQLCAEHGGGWVYDGRRRIQVNLDGMALVITLTREETRFVAQVYHVCDAYKMRVKAYGFPYAIQSVEKIITEGIERLQNQVLRFNGLMSAAMASKLGVSDGTLTRAEGSTACKCKLKLTVPLHENMVADSIVLDITATPFCPYDLDPLEEGVMFVVSDAGRHTQHRWLKADSLPRSLIDPYVAEYDWISYLYQYLVLQGFSVEFGSPDRLVVNGKAELLPDFFFKSVGEYQCIIRSGKTTVAVAHNERAMLVTLVWKWLEENAETRPLLQALRRLDALIDSSI